jgi:hypothetical protein
MIVNFAPNIGYFLTILCIFCVLYSMVLKPLGLSQSAQRPFSTLFGKYPLHQYAHMKKEHCTMQDQELVRGRAEGWFHGAQVKKTILPLRATPPPKITKWLYLRVHPLLSTIG